MGRSFRVGLTHDFLKPDGSVGLGDIGLRLLDEAPGVEWEFLAEDVVELRPDQIRDFDALIVLKPRVTAATLAGADRLSAIARFGVGYDSVDTAACTTHGVLLTITPDGVRRPVAVSVLTLLLALTSNLIQKDRLTREGRWYDRLDYMGVGLTGRVFGLIGLGNIGREVLRLAAPFAMRYLVHDPYITTEQAREIDAELVDLDTLLRESDFVSVNCPLTPETHHLLNAERLALLKPTAMLINTARGPIIDEAALTEVLRERRIAGAGLDVFEQEPIDPHNPLLTLDNAIVTPHALCWTDEMAAGNGHSALSSVLDVAAGRVPRHVVNRAVLETPRLQERLRQYARDRQEYGGHQAVDQE